MRRKIRASFLRNGEKRHALVILDKDLMTIKEIDIRGDRVIDQHAAPNVEIVVKKENQDRSSMLRPSLHTG